MMRPIFVALCRQRGHCTVLAFKTCLWAFWLQAAANTRWPGNLLRAWIQWIWDGFSRHLWRNDHVR